jgi:hypothetical protein
MMFNDNVFTHNYLDYEYDHSLYTEVSLPLSSLGTLALDTNVPIEEATVNLCYTIESTTTTTVEFDLNFKANIDIEGVVVNPRLSQDDPTLTAAAEDFSSDTEVSVTTIGGTTTSCGVMNPTT